MLCAALLASTELVRAGAGWYCALPACEATTRTAPEPMKLRFVASVMWPGPDATAKLTGSPEEAVAARLTRLVAVCSGMAGNVMLCARLMTRPRKLTRYGVVWEVFSKASVALCSPKAEGSKDIFSLAPVPAGNVFGVEPI